MGGTDFDRLLSLAEVMPLLGYKATTRGGHGLMPNHYYLDLATWHRINAVYTQRTLTDLKAVSYTHLDVYKRQSRPISNRPEACALRRAKLSGRRLRARATPPLSKTHHLSLIHI